MTSLQDEMHWAANLVPSLRSASDQDLQHLSDILNHMAARCNVVISNRRLASDDEPETEEECAMNNQDGHESVDDMMDDNADETESTSTLIDESEEDEDVQARSSEDRASEEMSDKPSVAMPMLPPIESYEEQRGLHARSSEGHHSGEEMSTPIERYKMQQGLQACSSEADVSALMPQELADNLDGEDFNRESRSSVVVGGSGRSEGLSTPKRRNRRKDKGKGKAKVGMEMPPYQELLHARVKKLFPHHFQERPCYGYVKNIFGEVPKGRPQHFEVCFVAAFFRNAALNEFEEPYFETMTESEVVEHMVAPDQLELHEEGNGDWPVGKDLLEVIHRFINESTHEWSRPPRKAKTRANKALAAPPQALERMCSWSSDDEFPGSNANRGLSFCSSSRSSSSSSSSSSNSGDTAATTRICRAVTESGQECGDLMFILETPTVVFWQCSNPACNAEAERTNHHCCQQQQPSSTKQKSGGRNRKAHLKGKEIPDQFEYAIGEEVQATYGGNNKKKTKRWYTATVIEVIRGGDGEAAAYNVQWSEGGAVVERKQRKLRRNPRIEERGRDGKVLSWRERDDGDGKCYDVLWRCDSERMDRRVAKIYSERKVKSFTIKGWHHHDQTCRCGYTDESFGDGRLYFAWADQQGGSCTSEQRNDAFKKNEVFTEHELEEGSRLYNQLMKSAEEDRAWSGTQLGQFIRFQLDDNAWYEGRVSGVEWEETVGEDQDFLCLGVFQNGKAAGKDAASRQLWYTVFIDHYHSSFIRPGGYDIMLQAAVDKAVKNYAFFHGCRRLVEETYALDDPVNTTDELLGGIFEDSHDCWDSLRAKCRGLRDKKTDPDSLFERHSRQIERAIIERVQLVDLEKWTDERTLGSRKTSNITGNIRGVRALTFGCVGLGSIDKVGKCTKATFIDEESNGLLENLQRAVMAYICLHEPDFCFTSAYLNLNSKYPLHQDAGNVGKSVIVALGDYAGGELWKSGSNGCGKCLAACRRHTIGCCNFIDIQRKPLFFSGKNIHGTEKFQGLRISIVYYINQKCREDVVEQAWKLKRAGINMPSAKMHDELLERQRRKFPHEAGDDDYKSAIEERERDTAARNGSRAKVQVKDEREEKGGKRNRSASSSSTSSSSSRTKKGKSKKEKGKPAPSLGPRRKLEWKAVADGK